MKYAVNVPPFGPLADARRIGELAHEAEEAGWDGFFLWDHVAFWPGPIADPWICLAAAALTTTRIKLGTMVTPIPRRRPQKLAKEMMTLDRLSGGRLILGVGLGIHPEEFEHLGDEGDLKVRGEMLDEGLDVLTGLLSGERFCYEGKHYSVKEALFDAPVQQPRIPVWVAGMWPNKRPFRRAARWDGVFPIDPTLGDLSPDDFRDIISYVSKHRTNDEPFDVSYGARSSGPDDTERARAYLEAGVTWWQEGVDAERVDRIRAGPPRA